MARSKSDLLKSKAKLTMAIEALRDEVRLIDLELAGYRKGVPLNEKFFIDRIVPALREEKQGLSSAGLQSRLERDGIVTNTVSLRTFLSRYKAKGRLTILPQYNPPHWQVVDEPVATKKRLILKRRS